MAVYHAVNPLIANFIEPYKAMPCYFKAKVLAPTDTRGLKIKTIVIESRKTAVVSWDHELNNLIAHFPRADFLFVDGGWFYFVGVVK